MSSRGRDETERLHQNLVDQLDRLVNQLSDLEECREDLDGDEYQDTKNDTLEQLREFEASLQNLMAGDMTLVDRLNGMQLAIQAAISEAFRTPEVIRMFAKRQPEQLRQRLTQLDRDVNLGKTSAITCPQQRTEILTALKKLGEILTSAEQDFLDKNSNAALNNFTQVTQDVSGDSVLKMAGSQVEQNVK